MYTAIAVALHPIQVIKTRQQVLRVPVPGNNYKVNSGSNPVNRFEGMRGLYRGMGIILVLAIPARGIYISTLEYSRQGITNALSRVPLLNDHPLKPTNPSPMIVSISGAIAGGLASMSAQTLVVPMDVISQRQMVMQDALYSEQGSAVAIMSDIMKRDGWKGFYRGFGMSLFTSLPVGSMWWGTYSGCQHQLQSMDFFRLQSTQEAGGLGDFAMRGMIQLISGLSAAVVAATITQPLDVVKTRLQVGGPIVSNLALMNNAKMAQSQQLTYTSVAQDLYASSGFRGFFRGTGPRIMSMGLWGTVLSSAYEVLRHVSRKDYEFNFAIPARLRLE